MSLDALIAEVKRLELKKAAKERDPYLFYSAHSGQTDFHNSPAKVRLLIGSTRSGKTTAGMIEALANIRGYRPDGSKVGLPVAPSRGLIVVQTFAKILDPLMIKMRQYANPGWIERIKNGTSGAPEMITFDNGSTVKVISHQQDPTAADSSDWDWAWADEPWPRTFWSRIQRGLADRNGKFWATFSPINCPWIFTELYNKADGVKISRHHINLRDNPYLSPEGRQHFIDNVLPEDRDAMIEGKFSHLRGAVFPEFDMTKHTVDSHVPPDDVPIFMVMDPHDRRPCYLLWVYIDKRNRVVPFAEWPTDDFENMDNTQKSIKDYCTIIRDVEGSWGKRVVERVMDPNFGNTASHNTGLTIVEEYLEHGINFFTEIDNGMGSINAGHSRIRELLKCENTEPGLLIQRHLRNLLWAFQVYSWNMRDMEERNSKDRVGEAGKDQIDVLRYLLSYGPSYHMGPQGESGGGSFDPKEYGGGYG